MDDALTYRSRDFDNEAHQRLLRPLLDQLAEDARATDPLHADSAAGKDHRAFSALLVAGELVDAVAGWAIDHVYGLSLAGRKMLPCHPIEGAVHPAYAKSRAQDDSHELEREGGEAIEGLESPASPAARRLILRNFVFAGLGGFPNWLRSELLEALDALDAGSTLPLLQAASRQGTKYEIARAQLELLGFVRFRAEAYGTTVDEAFAFVADRAGVSNDAMRKWDQRIKKSCLGELEIDRHLARVKNAASHVKEAKRKIRDGEMISKLEKAMADRKEKQFGIEGLTETVGRRQHLPGT